MKNLYVFLLLILFFKVCFAQKDQCGTMYVLKQKLEENPTLKQKIENQEIETQKWIELHRTNIKPLNSNFSMFKPQNKSLCGFADNYFTSVSAPTVLNQTVVPSPNCIYGGEYITLNGLISGNIYRISTCSQESFDTQITIYNSSGQAVAHNDDLCDTQSEIYFNPLSNGNYYVIVTEFDCQSNQICASLEIELLYTPRETVTIPVVVHIVHNGEAIGLGTNISDAQIQSQITTLNKDFRRLNSDINSVPAAFKGVSDDPLIQFCLAKQDEFGDASTGIERINGSQYDWTKDEFNNNIKPATIWDRNSYLNLWTCRFGGANESLLGYATFPSSATDQDDGVVISSTSFGTIGSVVAPYNKGRTATHEIGHWLNLKHIWGDEPGCDTDDAVFDTPIQDVASGGTLSFPFTDDCSVDYPGIMFYNYMDYTDDVQTSIFTLGQSIRMEEALFNQRASILFSDGCSLPSSSISEINISSIHLYPNPVSDILQIKAVNNLHKPYCIFSSEGQLIRVGEINLLYSQMNVSDFSKGVYYLHIDGENFKFVKL